MSYSLIDLHALSRRLWLLASGARIAQ